MKKDKQELELSEKVPELAPSDTKLADLPNSKPEDVLNGKVAVTPKPETRSPERETKNPKVDGPSSVFTSVAIDIDAVKVWKVPIMHIYYEAESFHMTVLFTSVGPESLDALQAIYNVLQRDYPSVKIKVMEAAPFTNHLRPTDKIYLVKPNIPARVSKMFTKMNRFEWAPHISFPSDAQIPTDLTGSLKFRLLYTTQKYRNAGLVKKFVVGEDTVKSGQDGKASLTSIDTKVGGVDNDGKDKLAK